MAVISLPLSFTNSFWTQDYRRGLEVLYSKLEQGLAENDEIITFIRTWANAEAQLATTLGHPAPVLDGVGFAADDGASLLMAFRGLQAEAAKQGDAHNTIAHELHTLVADPFAQWATGHKDRVRSNKAVVLQQYVRTYEQGQSEVTKLKNTYISKVRKADEAEDDARFAPSNPNPEDKYTTSPRLGPLGPPDASNRAHKALPQRTPSVSERIATRLKELQKKSAANLTPSISESSTDEKSDADEKAGADSASKAETATLVASGDGEDDDDDESKPSANKGKGKANELPPSPPALEPPLPPKKLAPASLSVDRAQSISPMPPPEPEPIVLGNLSLPPSAVSSLLLRASSELPLRPVRFALLGEYDGCFTGEEFVGWLVNNVSALERSWDRAEDAAKVLAEDEGLLRRVGEFGNAFESSDDAFYQFRPKAFELGNVQPKPIDAAMSPTKSNFAQTADSLLKRSGTFANLVQRAIASGGDKTSPYVQTRMEADEADREYRIAVRKLDRQRLGLEERIEETLKTLQRWEADRLRAVKTVLLQFQGTIGTAPRALEPSLKRSETLIAAYQPESDLNALIERYRTGPFRPAPQVYESVAHDEADVVFGIDLRKWADNIADSTLPQGQGEGQVPGTEADAKRPTIPPVLKALLDAMIAAYRTIPDDAERRKAWIYEVPLSAVHHLRESLNALEPTAPIAPDMLAKYDAPVLASAVRLWLLELDPPLALYEGWDEIRKIYPSVGSAAKADDEEATKKRIEELQVVLQRLPRVHLLVLDAIVQHLDKLVDLTEVDEDDEVYINKLGLSIGRAICRPKYETELSVQDRHPTLLFIDLITNYDEILPPTIAKKKRESERRVPVRKRTAPIDMRTHRSRLSVSQTVQAQIAAHETAKKTAVDTAPFTVASATPTSASSNAIMSSVPPTPVAAPGSRDSASSRTAFSSIPPPPPLAVATPPTPPQAPANGGRPMFKEPPPEDDDLPPRPSFREPPPELDDLPPRPQFKEPPPEDDGPSAPSPAAVDTGSDGTTGSPALGSPNLPDDDRTFAAKASLSRSGSGEARLVRGPRVKGQRGSVSSMVASLNKVGSPTSPTPTSGLARGHRTGASISDKRLSKTGPSA